jgi:hypothetical protein
VNRISFLLSQFQNARSAERKLQLFLSGFWDLVDVCKEIKGELASLVDRGSEQPSFQRLAVCAPDELFLAYPKLTSFPELPDRSAGKP